MTVFEEKPSLFYVTDYPLIFEHPHSHFIYLKNSKLTIKYKMKIIESLILAISLVQISKACIPVA